ncbi:MAG TPA: lysophospholipid acyltransferase family protein [Myxococcota bacterium]|nr:lysophospholipid acyltransferase family protein [Myxococcota bacterium]
MLRPREIAEYAAFRAAVAALRAVPLPTAQALAARAARALFARGGKRVEYVLANLRIAFPERSEQERRAIGRESYVHLAWNLLDVARGRDWGPEDIRARVEMEGKEIADAVLGAGKSAVCLSLHLGNFELLVRAVPLFGIPLGVIGRPLGNRLLREEIVRQRTSTGVELLLHRNVLPQMLRMIHKGRVVAVLNDQYARRSRGVFVPLFGVRASTSLGPAVLALRTGAPVVPAYSTRIGPDRHRLVVRPPIETPDTGDRRKDAELLTARCNAAMEEIIRAHPEQWMWSHRRFRHSPDLPGDPYGGR